MAQWHFRLKQPNEVERNPLTGEYFDEEAIDRPAQALVREVIQNSLDARASDETVRVRFFRSGEMAALSTARAKYWFDEVWGHLRSNDSGLRNVPVSPPSCAFLVVEDSGTIGLEGDVNASDLTPGAGAKKNHFYAFFRGEGISENVGGRGRWGVGKTVFPRSSRFNLMLGLSIRRSDGKSMLMGKAVLRYHRLGANKYAPDGLFGKPENGGFVLPFEEADAIDDFCNDFRVNRLDEAGLSVVVPYARMEITTGAITQAVAREYFYPILAGKLVVEIADADSGTSQNLDANTLVASLADAEPDLKSMILFSQSAQSFPQDLIIELPASPGRPPEWSDELVPAERRESLARAFAKGEMLGLRVAMSINEVGERSCLSYFSVFLRNDLHGRGHVPIFVRNGIIVPKAVERRVRGHNLYALVIIDDKPLGDFLANAEPPAHTSWSHNTQNFQGRYNHGRECIEFVRSAPRQLAEILSRSRATRDRLALAEFFPRPPDTDGEESRGGGSGPKPKPKPQPFEIEIVSGGFRVRRAHLDLKQANPPPAGVDR